MRRIRTLTLACFATMSAAFTSASAASVDPTSPEAAILLPVQVLRSGDAGGAVAALPEAQLAEAKAKWESSKTNATASDTKEFDAMLTKILAPNAVDNLMKEIETKLAEFHPAEVQQKLNAISVLLPMLIPNDAKTQTAALKAQGAMLTTMIQDVAAWIGTAGLDDRAKIKTALTALVDGAKKTGITSAADLHALTFVQALGKLPPLLAGLKKSLSVFDLQVDNFLDSVKAVPQGTGDQRTLNVTFSAFGHSHTLPVEVEKKPDGTWQVSPKNAERLGALGALAGGMSAP